MGLNEDALRANRDSLLRASSADVFEGNGYSLCRIVARIFPILNASLCGGFKVEVQKVQHDAA